MYFKTYIYREDEGIEVKVDYKYYKAHKGLRDSICGGHENGPALEPDEPESVDIEGVTNRNTGEEIELTEDEQDKIVGEILDEIHEPPDDDWKREKYDE